MSVPSLPLDPQVVQALADVSTATLTTVLLKHGLRNVWLRGTRPLAPNQSRQVGRDGITVNIVLPGRIATGRITFLDEQKAKRENRSIDDVVTESTGSIPLGRYGRPEEYGNVVTFLASEPASYLTGSVIRVDGGMIQSI